MLRRLMFAAAILGIATLTSPAQGEDKPLKKAPDFELKDQNGKKQKLSDMLKKGRVALVFYRSADW